MARARRLALVSTPSRRLRAARPTITDPNTVAAVEFTIGGRVGINSNTSVTVASERSVADYNLLVYEFDNDHTPKQHLDLDRPGTRQLPGRLPPPARIVPVSTDFNAGAITPPDNHEPNWSPNGKRIVFQSSCTRAAERVNLWAVSPDGCDLIQIADDPDNDTDPSFLPNNIKTVILDRRGRAGGDREPVRRRRDRERNPFTESPPAHTPQFPNAGAGIDCALLLRPARPASLVAALENSSSPVRSQLLHAGEQICGGPRGEGRIVLQRRSGRRRATG